MQNGEVVWKVALSTRTSMTGVGSFDLILQKLDLLFIEVEKVIFYESFLEGNKNDDVCFFAAVCNYCKCYGRGKVVRTGGNGV